MEFLKENWFNLIQSLGIIISLASTMFMLRWQSKQLRVSNFLQITSYHRELWSNLYSNNNLERIFKNHVNIDLDPITEQESVFMNLIFLHMSACLRAIKADAIDPIEGMERDVCDIMSYPIPRAVWRRTAPFHDQILFDFIEDYGKLPTNFWTKQE